MVALRPSRYIVGVVEPDRKASRRIAAGDSRQQTSFVLELAAARKMLARLETSLLYGERASNLCVDEWKSLMHPCLKDDGRDGSTMPQRQSGWEVVVVVNSQPQLGRKVESVELCMPKRTLCIT